MCQPKLSRVPQGNSLDRRGQANRDKGEPSMKKAVLRAKLEEESNVPEVAKPKKKKAKDTKTKEEAK